MDDEAVTVWCRETKRQRETGGKRVVWYQSSWAQRSSRASMLSISGRIVFCS